MNHFLYIMLFSVSLLASCQELTRRLDTPVKGQQGARDGVLLFSPSDNGSWYIDVQPDAAKSVTAQIPEGGDFGGTTLEIPVGALVAPARIRIESALPLATPDHATILQLGRGFSGEGPAVLASIEPVSARAGAFYLSLPRPFPRDNPVASPHAALQENSNNLVVIYRIPSPTSGTLLGALPPSHFSVEEASRLLTIKSTFPGSFQTALTSDEIKKVREIPSDQPLIARAGYKPAVFRRLAPAALLIDGVLNKADYSAAMVSDTNLTGELDAADYSEAAYAIVSPSTPCALASPYSLTLKAKDLPSDSVGSFRICVRLKDHSGGLFYGVGPDFKAALLSPKFNGISLSSAVVDGLLNVTDYSAAQPLAAQAEGTAFDVAGYKLVMENQVCDESLTFGPLPLSNDSAIGPDDRYKICVRLTNEPNQEHVIGASSSFVVNRTKPIVSGVTLTPMVLDGYLNAAEANSGTSLLGGFSASGYKAAFWSVVTEDADCGSEGGSEQPQSNYPFAVDGRYKVCGRFTNTSENETLIASNAFTVDRRAPRFISIVPAEVIQDGVINAGDIAVSMPLLSSVAGADHDTIEYAVVSGGTACDAATYSSFSMGDNSTAVPKTDTVVFISGTTYKVCARLSDHAGNAHAFGSTPAFFVETVRPISPVLREIRDRSSGTAKLLSWTNGSDDRTVPGALTYAICMSSTPGQCQAQFIAQFVTAPGATNHLVSGLIPGQFYEFLIRARDEAGNDDFNISALTTGELSGAVSVASGWGHSCALMPMDGSVRCWGSNLYGQIGDGTIGGYTTVATKVVGLSAATAIVSGNLHSCALLNDGAVKCWGYGVGGQLGNGKNVTSATPVATLPVGSAQAIHTSSNHTCAVTPTRGLLCWGANTSGQLGFASPTTVLSPTGNPGIGDVADVRAGSSHTCALKINGTIQCWGLNSIGQLGDGTSFNSTSPVTVSGITGATALSVGSSTSCVLLATHQVLCWGQGSNGQLGNGSWDYSTVPVPVSSITTGTAVSVGNSHACVLLQDGYAKCWGQNTYGALGDGLRIDSSIPVNVANVTGATQISAGSGFSCALQSDGRMICWGSNSSGQFGVGYGVNSPSPEVVSSLGNVNQVSTGNTHTCALFDNSSLQCWGRNNSGQLGVGTLVTTATPMTVSGLSTVAGVSSGGSHTCAIHGGGLVSCWGSNTSGQLGNSSNLDSSTPVVVIGVATATQVVSGSSHSCALLSDRTVTCWGEGEGGQLGHGFNQDSSVPVLVAGLTEATYLAAGTDATCAILNDKTARCWGRNTSGLLGNGNNTDSNVSVAVTGLSNVAELSLGYGHGCARRENGSVACWGSNSSGQLGTGDFNFSYSPKNVAGLNTAAKISSGSYFNCVVTIENAVLCWGSNSSNQLGNNSFTLSNVPVPVPDLNNAAGLSAKSNTACAWSGDKSVRCWGSSLFGGTGIEERFDALPSKFVLSDN